MRTLALPSAIGLSAGGFAACGGETCECTPPPEADCTNGTDDDGNGKTDCADPACAGVAVCVPESDCGNGIDDNGNGKTDCADPACAGAAACSTEAQCANGVDDDGDGAVDCLDCDCSGAAPCSGVITILPCM